MCSNMSAFKRKRAEERLEKKAKKVKIVEGGDETPDEVEEATNEFTIPPPVSKVRSAKSLFGQ